MCKPALILEQLLQSWLDSLQGWYDDGNLGCWNFSWLWEPISRKIYHYSKLVARSASTTSPLSSSYAALNFKKKK